jgi:nitrate reductase gamma subunit
MSWQNLDLVLFAVLPYVAMFTFLLATIQRYRAQGFTYSSLSSQFLENKQHFWGLVPFHYGVLVVTAGHFMGLFIPKQLLWWNSVPIRLYVLEATGLAFALLTIVGLAAAMVRRRNVSKVRLVTTPSDWVLFVLLMIQIALGIGVAVFYPWGSSWFATSVSPYLWSLFSLSPEIGYVSAMPLLVKMHIVNAWIVIAVFPFTRLVHVLVIPNPYLWRKPQVVRWNWNPGSIRRIGS